MLNWYIGKKTSYRSYSISYGYYKCDRSCRHVAMETLNRPKHCSTLFVEQHCSFNNIVCSTTLFVEQHCSFNNIVRWTTLFVEQHCSLNNIVRSTTLFVQQHCSFNNIVCSTTLFSHDNRVAPTRLML